ncbi:c-type cytochrome [Methyloprofundus sp.]|uniref:c-type cytochrome n=1 Tax=Methyloprofundus sp. TaxID=2020875 RepID=UPI003D0D752C
MNHRLCLWLCLLCSGSALAQPPTLERQSEIRNLLKHDCGSCHGLTLKGGLGPSLFAQDLVNKSDNYLIATIQNGRKGTAMPPWKPFISENETRWLVQELRRKPAERTSNH